MGRRMDTPKPHSCQLFWLHHTLYTTRQALVPEMRLSWSWKSRPLSYYNRNHPSNKSTQHLDTYTNRALINRNVFPVTVNTYISLNILFIPPQCLLVYGNVYMCSFVGRCFDLRQRVGTTVNIMPCIQTLVKGAETDAPLRFYHYREQWLTASNKDLVSSYGSIKTNSLITSAKDSQ